MARLFFRSNRRRRETCHLPKVRDCSPTCQVFFFFRKAITSHRLLVHKKSILLVFFLFCFFLVVQSDFFVLVNVLTIILAKAYNVIAASCIDNGILSCGRSSFFWLLICFSGELCNIATYELSHFMFP